jgi:predicted nuclease of predicted toxin-antitoxin system
MCLVLDENISPTLVRRLWEHQIDTVHVRDRGLLSSPDNVIWEFALSEKRAVVTINGQDFFALARQASVHHGVVVIPSGGLRDEMFSYIMAAIEWAKTRGIGPISFYQKFVKVNTEFEISAVTVFDQTLLRGEVRGVTRLYLA